MKLELECSCDVLVLGAGIAGIMAAIEAAEQGSKVILAAKGSLFSGSSFYPGTWGLGLIGPEDEDDLDDLVETIETVGCHMADPALVRTFVAGIRPSLEKLKSRGVRLRRAQCGNQREFIPCFDHKHRDWNGIEFASVRQVLAPLLEQLGVKVIPKTEALELVKYDGRVCGAVLAGNHSLRYIGCGAVVLATGGYGSLFRHHLCTDDVEGLGQSLALEAGCQLVNMEFMQIMPGFRSPAYNTVFNEKCFRFIQLRLEDGSPLLTQNETTLLDQRSRHGPFSSRLDSKQVDLALFRAEQRGQVVIASYHEDLRKNTPEFIKTYFDWLREFKGLSMEDNIQLGLFAHAANGGVYIGPDASTGIPGLYAAGEVTGGMHGADRIGGLSTANGLVFGGIAGRSAAAFGKLHCFPNQWEMEAVSASDLPEKLRQLQNTMYKNAFVQRSQESLTEAFSSVCAIRQGLHLHPSEDCDRIAATRRILGQLHTAEALLKAALCRKESRGSHFRIDYPQEDPSQQRQILVSGRPGMIQVEFSGKEDLKN